MTVEQERCVNHLCVIYEIDINDPNKVSDLRLALILNPNLEGILACMIEYASKHADKAWDAAVEHEEDIKNWDRTNVITPTKEQYIKQTFPE